MESRGENDVESGKIRAKHPHSSTFLRILLHRDILVHLSTQTRTKTYICILQPLRSRVFLLKVKSITMGRTSLYTSLYSFSRSLPAFATHAWFIATFFLPSFHNWRTSRVEIRATCIDTRNWSIFPGDFRLSRANPRVPQPLRASVCTCLSVYGSLSRFIDVRDLGQIRRDLRSLYSRVAFRTGTFRKFFAASSRKPFTKFNFLHVFLFFAIKQISYRKKDFFSKQMENKYNQNSKFCFFFDRARDFHCF